MLLREAVASGWVECPDALLSVLVDIGERYSECAPALQALQREALIALQRHGGDWRLADGITLVTGCEVCGNSFPMARRPGGLLREVEWDDYCVPPAPTSWHFVLNGVQRQAGRPLTGRARYDVRLRPAGRLFSSAPLVDGVVRYVITCRGCRRRKLVRCDHAMRNGDWRQCDQLAGGGADFCPVHRGRAFAEARRDRDRSCRWSLRDEANRQAGELAAPLA